LVSTATTETYPLSLHDALPISIAKSQGRAFNAIHFGGVGEFKQFNFSTETFSDRVDVILNNETTTYEGFQGVMEFMECALASSRSEEHTSELQSRENLVCRLLL